MKQKDIDSTKYGRGIGLSGCIVYSQEELDAAIAEAVSEERERLKADAELWGEALNTAAHTQIQAFRSHTGETESNIHFNMNKTILREAIKAYFDAIS